MYVTKFNGEYIMLCNHKHRSETAKKKCEAKTFSKLKQLAEAEKIKGGANIDSGSVHGQAD